MYQPTLDHGTPSGDRGCGLRGTSCIFLALLTVKPLLLGETKTLSKRKLTFETNATETPSIATQNQKSESQIRIKRRIVKLPSQDDNMIDIKL